MNLTDARTLLHATRPAGFVTERVQCGECGDQYDSEVHPFCPRCGALATAATPAAAVNIAVRNDPRRRRVQAAGVMMVATGAVTLLMFAATAFLAHELVPDTLSAIADQPGGDVFVQVSENGSAVVGIEVLVANLDGEIIRQLVTDGNGTATAADLEHAGTVVTVNGSSPWSRKVLSLAGSTTEVEADLSNPGNDEAWVGVHGFVQGSRALAGVFAAISLVTVVGGVAALRLRRRQFAVAGAVFGALPWGLLFVATMNILALVVLAMFVVAFIFVRQGRTLFASN